jgi:hypothetical protein
VVIIITTITTIIIIFEITKKGFTVCEVSQILCHQVSMSTTQQMAMYTEFKVKHVGLRLGRKQAPEKPAFLAQADPRSNHASDPSCFFRQCRVYVLAG